MQYWDYTQKGLDIESADKSSKAIIAGGVLVGLYASLVTLPGSHDWKKLIITLK